MRIGFFTETYHPQTNGVVTSIDTFGEELVKRGHEIHVFAPKTNMKEHLGMTIHNVPSIEFTPYKGYQVGLPFNVKVPKLDIVHTHGSFPMGIFGLNTAKKQGIPKVTTYHTLVSEFVKYVSRYGTGFTSRVAKDYCEYHYAKYDKIITPSAAIKSMLNHELQKKTTVIPTGIDINALKPITDARKKLKLNGYDNIFLSLGRISYEKEIDVILKAAPEFLGEKDILLIGGKGPAMKDIEALAKKLHLGKQVRFLGYIPEEQKPLYYSAADLFLTASPMETQGLVVNEAQACGTPVIAADALALPEMLNEGKDGYLFTPGDSKELARVIKYHRFDESMMENARKNALKFSIEKTTDKVEQLYKGLA